MASGFCARSRTRAVLKKAAPLRVEPHQLQVVLHARAGLGKDAAQHGGNGDDGRPHVEAEAVAAELRGLAAEPVVALEEDDLVSARGEHAGGGEAAEAAADDADGFHDFVFVVLTLAKSARRKSGSAASRRRPCAARIQAVKSARVVRGAARRNADASCRGGRRRRAERSFPAAPPRRAWCRSRWLSRRRTACADRRSERSGR